MTAFKAYKDGTIDKETYLKQKELYDRMEEKLGEGIPIFLILEVYRETTA